MNAKQLEEEIKYYVFENGRSILFLLVAWAVGWYGFSYTWLLIGVLILLWWRNKTDVRSAKRKALRLLVSDERKFVLSYKCLPSWVCFPDVEKAEWLNQLISQLWPFISKMVGDILKNSAEPEIKKALPSVIKSFHFVDVDLGNKPVQIGGIRVYTEHVRPNEMIMDVELLYAGDAVFKVGIDPGITAGISDLQIRGTLRIEFKPLLSKVPLIGGVTFYFMEQPEFDMDFTNLLNVLDFPGLSDILRKILGEVIESFIVPPNRISVPIGDAKDLEIVKYPLPLGVLKVHVLGATDLVASDKSLFSKDSSDPYVLCKVGSFKYTTKVKKNTLSPKWKDEFFQVFINSVVGTKLKLVIYDDDPVKDDSIGETEVDLIKVAHSSFQDLVLPLTKVKNGTIHVTCGWFEFSDDVKALKKKIEAGKNDTEAEVKETGGSSSCLFVKLDNARDLPGVKMTDGTCSAYVELTCGSVTKKSKTQRNTKKPVWEQIFMFFVNDVETEKLKIKVLDENSEEPLGKMEYNIAKLMKSPKMKVKDDFALKDCFTNGYINMGLELKALISPEACEET